MNAAHRGWLLALALSGTGCTALVSNDFTRGPGPEAGGNGGTSAGEGGSGGTGAPGGSGAAGAPGGGAAGEGGSTAGAAGMAGEAGAGGDPGTSGAGGESAGSGGSAGAAGSKDCMPKGLCPSICANGCLDGTCRIDCGGDAACKDAKDLKCPEGYPCTIVCGGKDSCAKAKLTCSLCGQCRVECSGVASCNGTEIRTGKNGMVDCGDAVDACKDAKIRE